MTKIVSSECKCVFVCGFQSEQYAHWTKANANTTTQIQWHLPCKVALWLCFWSACFCVANGTRRHNLLCCQKTWSKANSCTSRYNSMGICGYNRRHLYTHKIKTDFSSNDDKWPFCALSMAFALALQWIRLATQMSFERIAMLYENLIFSLWMHLPLCCNEPIATTLFPPNKTTNLLRSAWTTQCNIQNTTCICIQHWIQSSQFNFQCILCGLNEAPWTSPSSKRQFNAFAMAITWEITFTMQQV